MKTLAEIFDESAVWHLPGRSSLANDYQGREAARLARARKVIAVLGSI